ncbi:carbohydrate kinase family protein [Paucibacter sp. KCTC 42545]|uniref:carbohydrate kinase family protein n=1 Tax=Paucibacter sp. KCTC 42545 TaxID=1768242 RepID=UPI000733AC29|nr:carbohydrate kinase [Paucibacter sp. KCTC 42545]ALT75937.1 sugar kinase [Paucibacter sp. KCTC 42545]
MPDHFPKFVAIGEALTDLIRVDGAQWLAKTGGSTWNVARAAAALGLPSAFAGAISQCHFGDALWQASQAAGLDLRFLQRLDRSPLLAVVPQSAPPSYFFIGENSADLHFDPHALPLGWQAECQWAHFGGISLARDPLAPRLLDLAEELHAAKIPISYDPNFRNAMGPGYLATFERMCRLAQVIKLSDEDLGGLLPDVAPEQALAQARAWNPSAWWLYTLGSKGAELLTPQGCWRGVPPPIDVVDTVGAGDASIAGLVASLLRQPSESLSSHLAYAVAAGTAACTRAGATPPSLDAVMTLQSLVSISACSQPTTVR